MPLAHSTTASFGPAYSSTIASCTMVSSRWVAGLSTGSLPVSATMTMTSATKARTPAGETTCPGLSMVCATTAPRLAEPTGTDNAKMASRMCGLDKGGDGDLAARAHAAEGRSGVDAGQGERDRAQEQQPHDREQVGARVQR